MLETLVLTPGGLKPASHVHEVPEGFVLTRHDGMAELRASRDAGPMRSLGPQPLGTGSGPLLPGAVRAPSKGDVPRAMESPRAARSTFAQVDGWISYTGWTCPDGRLITRFSTTWTVPPEPRQRGSQTGFLFNGIQNSAMILQPVLQWGVSAAGGGPRWSIACWYADSQTGHTAHTRLMDVTVGTTLVGVMSLTGKSADGYDYVAEFVGMPGTRLTALQQDVLTWANETLEAYRITSRDDFPEAPATRFGAIQLDVDGVPAPLVWDARCDHPETGSRAIVVDGSSRHGEVHVTYA